MPLTLYNVPVVVHLAIALESNLLNNYPLTRTDFNIILGINNLLNIFIRDIDRQLVTLPAGQNLVLNIVDTENQVLLLSRQLVVVDPTQGLYSATITSADTLQWNTGAYSYSVTIVDSNNNNMGILWTDRNYTPYGYCYVVPGPIPGPQPATVLDPSAFIITDGWATSPRLPGSLFPNGAQTFAIYMTEFIGPIRIQASLKANPQDNTDWFQIEMVEIPTPYTGVQQVTTVGNYLWLRIQTPVIEYVLDPSLPLPVTSGTVNQILYKN